MLTIMALSQGIPSQPSISTARHVDRSPNLWFTELAPGGSFCVAVCLQAYFALHFVPAPRTSLVFPWSSLSFKSVICPCAQNDVTEEVQSSNSDKDYGTATDGHPARSAVTSFPSDLDVPEDDLPVHTDEGVSAPPVQRRSEKIMAPPQIRDRGGRLVTQIVIVESTEKYCEDCN